MKKFATRYRLFLALLALNLVLLFAAPELGRQSLSLSLRNLKEMLCIIPPVFVLMGLMDVWVPRETMMRYMGKGAGLPGHVFAFALGAFSAGPLYAAFPVAAVFLKKGVSLANVFLFVGAWSAGKIPMMLFEVTQLGARFAFLRFALNGALMALLAFLLERLTPPEEQQAMRKRAQERA